jgi:hypothetical protein
MASPPPSRTCVTNFSRPAWLRAPAPDRDAQRLAPP